MLSEESFEAEVTPDDAFLVLRNEVQNGVIEAALDYIASFASRDAEGRLSFGRIVMPPRVGKTVVAARITDRMLRGLPGSMVFLSPRKALVDQAADELAVHLPGIPVYRMYSGMREELGEEGVLVTTYETFMRLSSDPNKPAIVQNARLVFLDEAHHTMTEIRRQALRNGFHREAVRIALTATPDFDEERVLARDYPDLIHEMTIYEGVQMKLLAPVRASVYEIECGDPTVGIIGGDFDPRDVERMMTRAPLLQAIREFRYADESKHIPALICCTTRTQARLVWEYLAVHGPVDAPTPGLILGDTPDVVRRRLLDQYENGRLDTLITVGVLIEGWNSLQCKLLIDAAPSLSQVRAAQKYTRPMTRVRDLEARIVVLIPMGMDLPVLPLDVFGPGVEELPEDRYEPVKRARPSQERKVSKSAWDVLSASGVKMRSVNIRIRMLEDTLIHKLDIQKSLKAIRELVDREFYGYLGVSSRDYSRFMSTRFRVDEMKVSGRQILRFLGFRTTFRGYIAFMSRYFPKVVADRLLAVRGITGSSHIKQLRTRQEEILYAIGMKGSDEHVAGSHEEIADQAWLSYMEQPAGPLHDVPNELVWPLSGYSGETVSPYSALITKLWVQDVQRLLDTLSPMEARVLRWRFGIDGEDELGLKEIGDKYNLSRERIRQIQEQALAKVRRQINE